MDKLTPMLVAEVAAYLKGTRLQKFLDSVQVINVSLAQGGWTPRGSVKALSGFYQGLTKTKLSFSTVDHGPVMFELDMCVRYGDGRMLSVTPTDEQIAIVCPKVPLSVVRAWIELCSEKAQAYKGLNAARPVPVITPIGLSPKVTATLTECGLDLELPSIRMAKIDFYEVHDHNEETGELKYYRDGSPVMKRVYFVAWTPGILHNRSRFARGPLCHACGKRIPSGLFVPIEATCKKQGLISMWLGCDCARNIFGIKDVGIEQKAAPTP